MAEKKPDDLAEAREKVVADLNRVSQVRAGKPSAAINEARG